MFKKNKDEAASTAPEAESTRVIDDGTGFSQSNERLAPSHRSTEDAAPAPETTAPETTAPPVHESASDRRAAAAGFDSRGKVRRTRAGAWWAGLIVAALLAIALLIFIAQNSQKATINYLGFSGNISLAVALLGAAASGVLLVGIPGAVRIAQLRRALKKNVTST